MAVHRFAITVGQTAPGNETHVLPLIEKQDRGTIAAQSFFDRIECRNIKFFERICRLPLFEKAIQQLLLPHYVRERRFAPFALSNIQHQRKKTPTSPEPLRSGT